MKMKIVKLLNCYTAKSKGFTLIELLIAMAILAILVTGLIVTLNPFAQIQKANDARRKADIAQIQKALETYYQDNGAYPSSADYKINAIDWGDPWIPYMGNLPKDPDSSKQYAYFVPPAFNGQTYYLYASLDRETDSQACSGGTDCQSVPAPNLCGGKVCNYGASSPDVAVAQGVPTVPPPPIATPTPTPLPTPTPTLTPTPTPIPTPTPTPFAIGGTVTSVGGYTIHTFTSSGTFTVNGPGSKNAEVLVVGGGGGGGTDGGRGGGGGAGGYQYNASFAVTAQAYTVTVGAGGAKGVHNTSNSQNGQNSVFSTITAIGGGRGGGRAGDANPECGGSSCSCTGGNGGSGGGGCAYYGSPGGAGTAGQGNGGGIGATSFYGAGGGGGRSGVGENASGIVAGNGGAGINSNISGVPLCYAGGGGGGSSAGTDGSATCGGGKGGNSQSAAAAGMPNTGGGGGGAAEAGGSGIVIIRYL
ncbi:MAG: hypothetical protein A3H79_01230 [Candidatus Levybacteria bacterium RIFCSPLOWO2_02_FULL_36_8b]|nr:MAG: hypothetical protein A3H79_01230 [Candidatus Levybacteria bacterium RIFCSPLOWO2_02_FULL_36_8b]